MEEISERVKNELVFMNLIESLQKLWARVSNESLFSLSDFQDPSKLSLLYQRTFDLIVLEEKKQQSFEADLLKLKKELYSILKQLEEEIKNRKQLMLNESKKTPSQDNDNEIFKLDENIAKIKADSETLTENKAKILDDVTKAVEENEKLCEKINENKNTLNILRDVFADLKAKKTKKEEEIRGKIAENNEILIEIKTLETSIEKINKNLPELDELSQKLTKEYQNTIENNEKITKQTEEIAALKAKLEEELSEKESQIKEITTKKNKLEALYAREGILQQQLKLENEINTTLLLENEVLVKQHEYMSDKSTSNSLIFLMNESLANKMSIQPNEFIEFPQDSNERKNSDYIEKKRITAAEFDRELKEKKILIEALKSQMQNGSTKNGKEKLNQELALKIAEIEEILKNSEEELEFMKV